MDNLAASTIQLSRNVKKMLTDIRSLKEEMERSQGEARRAYQLVIRDKMWRLTQLVGVYWRETLDVLNQEEASLHLPVE